MRMTERTPATPLQVLQTVNAKGMVAYAHGGKGEDWPALNACLTKGWLVYSHTRKVPLGPKSSYYRITETGKAARSALIKAEKTRNPSGEPGQLPSEHGDLRHPVQATAPISTIVWKP